ncbi:MAG: pantetheine-phosphate adenylyltransferase [Bacteroidales bacterium]|nr:pantetheine-phosphate adenylyltransferase [Bacteroidales bacterium]
MEKRIAVFPGSFDPFTIGHENIVRRALKLFDKVIVAIGVNSQKKYMFPIERRLEMIRHCFAGEQRVEAVSYEGLTVEFCKKVNAKFIVRGVRNGNDFLFEQDIANANALLSPDIETIFIATAPELAAISSTIVREICLNGGDYSKFVPAGQ